MGWVSVRDVQKLFERGDRMTKAVFKAFFTYKVFRQKGGICMLFVFQVIWCYVGDKVRCTIAMCAVAWNE